MQQQTSSKLGMINSLVLLGVTIAALFLSQGAQATAGLAAVLLLGIGTVIGFFAFVHSHLISRERLEELEMQALDQSRGDQSLFAGAAEDAYPAHNARRQFEKWVVPGFTVLVLLGQALGLLWLYVELTGNVESGDAGDRLSLIHI